ncbi:MAG TPA: acyl-CoA thioesterase, partial [Planctomycetaceae bacterium]|nr:acyl-CoA thioesterase [Planctomycetaceae bacterium]
MTALSHTLQFRVRYSEVDQMGTYYNSRPLEWFERGRVELVRSLGMSYREMEQRGILLPVREAYVRFLGRAEYDDLLRMTTTLTMPGRAQVRFDVTIDRADDGRPVCHGWTVHPVTDRSGRPIRPPRWL